MKGMEDWNSIYFISLLAYALVLSLVPKIPALEIVSMTIDGEMDNMVQITPWAESRSIVFNRIREESLCPSRNKVTVTHTLTYHIQQYEFDKFLFTCHRWIFFFPYQ